MKPEKVIQRTEEWFQLRKGRITASMVGAILGCNPWMTKEQVMRRMVREWNNAPSEDTDNPAMAYGRIYEHIAKQQYIMDWFPVQDCGFFPYEDWLGASPDGLVLCNDQILVYESKCPYSLRDKVQPQFKSISEQPYYYAQIQVQLACVRQKYPDVSEAAFYQWAPSGNKNEQVFFDSKYWNKTEYELRKFYEEFLVQREEPSCTRYIEPKWYQPDPDEPAYKSIEELLKSYDNACELIDHFEVQKKAAIEKLVELTKGKNSILNGRKLTQVHKQGSISYLNAIKDLAPDADLEKYRKKGTSYWQLQKSKD